MPRHLSSLYHWLGARSESRPNFFVKGKGVSATHNLLDGGMVDVSSVYASEMRQQLAKDIEADKTDGPGVHTMSLSENHTMLFPFYVDVDLETPREHMPDEVLMRLCRICNQQVSRFFVSLPDVRCVICTKTGGSSPISPGEYKHGIHLHWPKIIIDVDKAYFLCASIVAGLAIENWLDDLGVRSPNWEKVIDRQVYSGGLRMIGAPKAVKCSKGCKRDPAVYCSECSGSGYTYSTSVYALHSVLDGDAVNEADTDNMRSNTMRVLRATSVRCDETQHETPGYARYVGCPIPAIGKKTNKRKATESLGRGFRSIPPTEPMLIAIRRHLVQHNDMYANTQISDVRFDGKVWKIILDGDGARWCRAGVRVSWSDAEGKVRLRVKVRASVRASMRL